MTSVSEKPQKNTIWRWFVTLILPAVFSIGLLWLATRNVDWQKMLHAAQSADVLQLIPMFFLLTLSYVLRGLRWHLLLTPTITRLQSFFGVCVAYLGNTFLPARAGEGMRALMLGRSEKTSTSFVLATVIIERLIETLTFVTIFSFLFGTIVATSDILNTASTSVALVGVMSVVFLLALPALETPLVKLIRWIPLPDGLQKFAEAQLMQFVTGMRLIQNLRTFSVFIAYTAIIILIEVLFLRQAALAFDTQLPLDISLFLYTCLGLSSVIPSTPGAIGVYQFVAVTVLTPLNYASEQVLLFITALQAVMIVSVLLWGTFGLWRLRQV